MLMIACGGENKVDNKKPPEDKKILATVPIFNEDSAYAYIKAQVDMGPRIPNTEIHKKCADWLAEKLKSFGAEVFVQKVKLRAFNGTLLNAQNIIGSINTKANARILLCSHWDSRPWADNDADSTKWKTGVDAANDGAGGVGVLIEIARILQKNNPNIGVDILLIDAEDYGPPEFDRGNYPEESWGLGSQYWAKNPHVTNYKARFGILLDMVGVPNAHFARESFSEEYASDILTKVWSAATRAGYGNYFANEQGGAVNDDHLYINKYSQIPTIDIIHFDRSTKSGFYKYWHTSKDNMDGIDKKTLKAVGQTLLTVIFEEALPA